MNGGMKHGGGRADVRTLVRYEALVALAERSPFGPEAEQCRKLAAELRRETDHAYLRAYIPHGRRTALSTPDRYVVLVDDVPWWRAHLALMCASFAGFEETGATWELCSDLLPVDYRTRLVGPGAAVLETRVLYAACSLGIAASIPFFLPTWVSPMIVDAWCWGGVAAVQDDLAAIAAERQRDEQVAEEARRRKAIVLVRPSEEIATPTIDATPELERDEARSVEDHAQVQVGASPKIDGMMNGFARQVTLARTFVQARRVLAGLASGVLKGRPTTLGLPHRRRGYR